MWAQKLLFIPLNVALWLQDIRKIVEEDELPECVAELNGFQELHSSNDSVYDNVDFSVGESNVRKYIYSDCEPVDQISILKTFHKKVFSETFYWTWPLWKHPRKLELFNCSLRDLFENRLSDTDDKFDSRYPLKKGNHEINHFDFVKNKLLTIKRDITYKRHYLGESCIQEREEPNLRASMSNLLASHREKHSQEYSKAWLNDKDLFSNVNVKNDKTNSKNEIHFPYKDSRNRYKVQTNECRRTYKSKNSTRKNCKSLPASFSSVPSVYVRNNLSNEFLVEKPPVPPKRTHLKMYRNQPSVTQNGTQRKPQLAKAKAVVIPTVHLKTRNVGSPANPNVQKNSERLKNKLSLDCILESAAKNHEDFTDNKTKKPLPFPAFSPELECEISELLMMQKVTESSKERRRIFTESKPSPILEESTDIFQGCIKNIPKTTQWPLSIQSSHQLCAEKMSDYDLSKFICNLSNVVKDIKGQDKVKQFLEFRKNKLKYETKPKIPLKLREDIIIDWENDYENLSEPLVLEGKSVTKKFLDVHLRNKVQTNTENEKHGLDMPASKCSSYDENYGKILDYSTGTDELSSLISDSSMFSQSSAVLEERLFDMRNPVELTKKRFNSEITELVTRYDDFLKERNPKCDTEAFDIISLNSTSDGLNSYSDFESDINETIAIGQVWYCEKLSEEKISTISCDVSKNSTSGSYACADDEDEGTLSHRKSFTTDIDDDFEESLKSFFEVKVDTIPEYCWNKTQEIVTDLGKVSVISDKLRVKSLSDSNLEKLSHPKPMSEKLQSNSLDFFRDSLTEDRLNFKCSLKKHYSITSDVCEWMAKIREIAFAEDQLFCNDNEWILSFDSEERAYFFEETSKKSLWALPDYSSENTRPEYKYVIQRSATESAISNEAPTKIRLNKNGSQTRVSASTRSSKAQSMLIEPKLNISPKDENKTFSMPRDLSKTYGEIIRIGILNKTKISENGKKLRKNWTPSFIVLTDSYLFFFKDAKSFQNMKNVIGSNGNHMCLNLQGAVIEKGEKISSRKNVYRISCSDNTEVLIQTDKTSVAEEWFREISSIIEKLSDNPPVRSSPLLDSKSSSRVGRTKSLKVRSKDSGSMEDLSSTPEERQNKIKARLKKFFNRRPTVDSLKKKGIWKDEPVFGCSLEQITKNRNPRVPVFVEKCIECIESKEENMKTDGLYRASGNLSQVQKIRLEVDQNNLNIMKEEEDVHVLTGSLKLFFRELKEPLIPSKQLEPALLATDKHTRKERIKDFQKIVKNLPTPNYDTLKFLLQHLLRVKEYHKFNRMNINNLAIVFGPTLMWPEQESTNMALELMQQNVVIECLLKEFQEIFT